jgi:hypothetical protein
VRGGLSSAYDPANRLFIIDLGIRPGVDHKQQHRPNKPDRVPAVPIVMRVGHPCLDRSKGVMAGTSPAMTGGEGV